MVEFLLTFSGSLMLGALLVLINIKAAYHPYHKTVPLIFSSLLILGFGLYMSMIASLEGETALIAMRQATSLAVNGLLSTFPVFFALVTLMMLRISVRPQ